MSKDNKRSAGKGMAPRKGYNYKKWSEGWDQIDWSDKGIRIEVKIDKNTTGILYEIDGRTEAVSGSNG